MIAGPEESTVSSVPYYPSQSQSQFPSASSTFQQYTTAQDQLPQDLPPITMRSSDNTPRAPSIAMPMRVPADLNRSRRRRQSRRGSGSSSDLPYSSSAGSSSSSSYLDISRWYPSFGRSGGVLNAFFKTPSEHKIRRRRSGRKQVRTKKTKGIFAFGNNSSSSSVNSDMAYGMGFIKKPKSRGGGFSPDVTAAAAFSSRREASDAGRHPPMKRRQTDEEIIELGRKLDEFARKENREDRRRSGRSQASQFAAVAAGAAAATTWNKFQRQSSSGMEASSSRGLGPSRPDRRHHASSSDEGSEWESASEDEDSDEGSALAYGHAQLHTPRPEKTSVSRISRVGERPLEDIRSNQRKSSVVDPTLFGPYNSLRDFINTPCGFNDGTRPHNFPETGDPRYAGSAESASFEATPLRTVYAVPTSDPAKMEAARTSGSIVSGHTNYSTAPRDRMYSTASATNRADPIPIQAPKPFAPVPSRMYDEERIHDNEPSERRELRRHPSDSKTFAETALVGAGVAAIGAAILAGRDKGKAPERKHGRDEKFGHEDHREDDTKVLDARKAKELALAKEIERLERALAGTHKAREQRRRDSKRDSDPRPDERAGRRETEAGAGEVEEEDHEQRRERRRRERQSRRNETVSHDGEYGIGEGSESSRSFKRPSSSRVSEPSARPAVGQEDEQHRSVEDPSNTESKDPINVFQFQVPDDAFRTRNSPPGASSPLIIDVTPSPSPTPEQARKSRRDSFEDEMRDAEHIHDEARHSTAPIDAVAMTAAIAATEHSRRHHDDDDDDEGRGRSKGRTPEEIQEDANRSYRAERVARSRSNNQDEGANQPRIVTPPGMAKPEKNMYSEPNADIRFDNMMSPTELREYWPRESFVRDPSAERPRPVLNLVMPTPVPTPSPEKRERKPVSKAPEPVEEEPKKASPSVVLGPKGEAFEAVEVTETPPTPKRVSWGPSETKQYEFDSREGSRERPAEVSEKPKSSGRKSSGGWGTIAAAITGASVGAALSRDDQSESSKRGRSTKDTPEEKRSAGSRSPPKERPILPTGVSSRVPDEEPEELPPIPGPKPASPRSSQMPGAFGEDLDFAATLAAGLEHSGFDPEIVIENSDFRRRDSPPGSNEPFTGVYAQPFAETATDLGMFDLDDGSRPARGSGYVIGEVGGTPPSEKVAPFEEPESASHGQDKKRSSSDYGTIEVVEEPEEIERDPPKLSKKEQRKLEKAAKASKLAEEEWPVQTEPVEAGVDEWASAPSSKKSKKPKKSKRSSVAWDDADTPVNDSHVSVPVHAFDDIKDVRGAGGDEWDTPKKSKKSKRDSKGYDLADADPPDKQERHRDPYEPLDRDASSVVSDSRYDDRSNGHSRDDDRSVVSAPSESDRKRDSKSSDKRNSGGLWGLFKGSPTAADDKTESKKGNAGILGTGAGLAGAAMAIAALARSDAAEAPSGQKEPHVGKDVQADPGRDVDVFDFKDPEIVPRVIKPAIDPQYGDLLPLPPSPSGKSSLEYVEEDDLPGLPDSRPATPPGQKDAQRERAGSQKRPPFASHSRRTSTHEPPLRSPSHTAIPIQFRMGQHRSPLPAGPGSNRSSPVVGVRSPSATMQQSPETPSPTFTRQPSRPTSWDSSREIKPLYLLEQAGRPPRGGEEGPRDEVAEATPLPPSREPPAPEGGAEDADMVPSLGPEDTPLFVDTDAARSTTLGSQESTPRNARHVAEPEVRSPTIDPEETPLEIPTSSSYPGSSYATPMEFSSQGLGILSSTAERESGEGDDVPPLRLESVPEHVQATLPEASDKQEKKSYFPSALSMLPAATLAGVGVLLGRGKSDESNTSKTDAEEPPSQSVDQTIQESPNPRVEPSEVELTSPNGPFDGGDRQLPASELAEALPLSASPHDAKTDPTMASPEIEGEPSDTRQAAPFGDDSGLESLDKPLDATELPGVSTGTQQPVDLSYEDIEQPKSSHVTEEGESEPIDDLGVTKQEMARETSPSHSEVGNAPIVSQPEALSGDGPSQAGLVEEPALIISEPAHEFSQSHSETAAGTSDVQGPSVENVFAERGSPPAQPVDDDWAPASSKKGKKNKKKKKQSISHADDVVENPEPDVFDNKAAVRDLQDTTLSQDPMNALESPRDIEPEQAAEGLGPRDPLEIISKALDTQSTSHDLHDQSHVGPASLIQESVDVPSDSVDMEESAKETPSQRSPILLAEPIAYQSLAEEPSPIFPEQPDSPLQGAEPAPVLAEDEFPVISKKAKKKKKNEKKRKSSTVLDEGHKAPETTTPVDAEQLGRSSELPQQPASTTQEDAQSEVPPPESKEVSTAPEARVFDDSISGRTSSSPVDDVVEALGPSELPIPPLQEETQIGALPSESTKTPESPQQEVRVDDGSVRQELTPLEPSTETVHLVQNSNSQESANGPSELGQTIDSTTGVTASPVQDDLPIGTSASDPHQSSIETQEESHEAVEQEEVANREAEAAKVQEEETELARLQLKRKPSKKDKQRVKDLRARAEKRSEEAEMLASSSSHVQAPEPEAVVAPSFAADSQAKELPSQTTGESISSDQGDQSSASIEPQRPDLQQEIVEQVSAADSSVEVPAQADEDRPESSQPPAQESENPEEAARREAEAALIQEEEIEMNRLKIKRKPSKKDKERIKVLKANTERRDREATIQRQVDDISQDLDDDPARTDISQNIVQSPAEEISRSTLEDMGLEDADGSSQPHVNFSTPPPQFEDHIVSDMASIGQPQAEQPVFGQSEVPIEQVLDLPWSTKQEVGQSEHRDGPAHDSLSLEHSQREAAEITSDNPERLEETPLLSQDQGDTTHDDMAQLEGQAEVNRDNPVSQLHEDDIPSETVATPPGHVQDPALTSDEFQEQDKDVTTGFAAFESQQSPATEPQPEPDWFVPSKKSKKDKKKKRKGTISGDSGQNSGLVTPLEANELITAVAPAEVDEVVAATPLDQALSSPERETSAFDPSWVAPLEQHQFPTESGFAAEVARPTTPVLDDSPTGAQNTTPRNVETLEQTSSPVIVKDDVLGASPFPEPERSDSLGPIDGYPSNLEHPAAVASSDVALDQPVAESKEIHTEPHQSPIGDDSSRAEESTQDVSLPEQGIVQAVETSRDLPLEAGPSIPAVDQRQQLPDDNFTWAPSKKSKRDKKKKRSSTSWTEPESGVQSPIGEGLVESGSRDIPATRTLDEAGPLTKTLAQDEIPAHISDSQQQIDDWSTPPPKKGKKGKKKKNWSSISSWEPESSTQAPPDDEPEASQDMEKSMLESSAVVGAGGIGAALASQTAETLQQSPVSTSEPDLSTKQHDTFPMSEREVLGRTLEETDPQSSTPVNTSLGEPVSKPDLESIARDGDDTLIVAGGKLANEDLSLAGEQAATPESIPHDVATEFSQLNEPLAKPDLDAKVRDGEDTLIVAGGSVVQENVSLPGEETPGHPHLDTSSQPTGLGDGLSSEPVTKIDLESKAQDGEDTLIVAGGRFADEVSEPWAFEATHRSDTMSKPDLEARVDDGDDTIIVAGGRLPDEVTHPSQTRDDSQETPELPSDFLDVDRPSMRSQSPVPWEHEDRPSSPQRDDELLDVDRPSIRSQSPVHWEHEDRPSSPQRDDELLDVDQPSVRPVSPVPWEDDKETDAFVTPSEERPGVAEEPQAFLSSGSRRFSDDTAEAVSAKDELSAGEFDESPRRLSKRGWRKAKKGSVSSFEPEAIATPAEDDDKLPTIELGGVDAVQQADRTWSEPDLSEEPSVEAEDIDKQALESPTRLRSLSTEEPDSLHQEPPEALVLEAVDETPVLSRKMSKKEKRKAKKKTNSSWDDEAFETSTAAEEDPSQADPVPFDTTGEPETSQEKASEILSPTRSQPTEDLTENLELATTTEAVPEDEWAIPVSRKKSKKDKKRKGKLSEPASGTQTPLADEPATITSAQFASESPRSLEHERIAEPSAENTSVPKIATWDSPAEPSEMPSGAHVEPKSPVNLGTELQKMASARPSPDIWENEDYFKPKDPVVPVGPPNEPFDKFEIHPAFTRQLTASPEKRKKDERPLVGLGLIHRHSSIFQEDDDHTPKLLTMAKSNLSVESMALEDAGPSGGSPRTGASHTKGALETESSSDDNDLRVVNIISRQTANALSARNATPSYLEEGQSKPPHSPNPSRDDLQQTPGLDDGAHSSRPGSVALLAERFGGSRKGSGKTKNVPNNVDDWTPLKGDMGDEPGTWENIEREHVLGSRLDADTGDLCAQDQIYEAEEVFDPNTHPGQNSRTTTPDRETQFGGDNVSPTHSPTGQDAGRFTPHIPEKASREEDVPLEPLAVESPVLGSQSSFEIPAEEPRTAIHSPASAVVVDASETADESAGTTGAATDDVRHQQHEPLASRSASPASDRGASLGESALPSMGKGDDTTPPDFIPAVDFGRSVSRGLPSVQEEPQEEEVEAEKHAATLNVASSDINRDSGFVGDSPSPLWARRFNDAQQRDSGVHLRDDPDASVRPRGSGPRGVSPEHSPENEGAKLDDPPGVLKYQETPVTPVTPEPQKSRGGRSRSRKYPDLGPGATTAAALAGGAALLAGTRADATPSPAPSTAPSTTSSTKRAVSNTSISRARTPEPLNLRPDSPSLLRHSATPPLRSRRTRSGDLRSLSQSSLASQRSGSHSDLGAPASLARASPSPSFAPVSAHADTPAPASSSSSGSASDLRKATTPASAPAGPSSAQPSNSTPTANEGRVRSKDMADVYVSRLHCNVLSFFLSSMN